MKRLVIIILVLLVVALGGAGGLVMLGIVRNPFQTHTPTATAEEQGPETGADGFMAPTEQLQLVKMPDMIIPVIVGSDVRRRVSLSIRLVARTSADKSNLQDALDKYQNALLQDLVPYFQDYFQDHAEIDIDAVDKKLHQHAQELYGDTVTDVLLVNVFESGNAPPDSGTHISDD